MGVQGVWAMKGREERIVWRPEEWTARIRLALGWRRGRTETRRWTLSRLAGELGWHGARAHRIVYQKNLRRTKKVPQTAPRITDVLLIARILEVTPAWLAFGVGVSQYSEGAMRREERLWAEDRERAILEMAKRLTASDALAWFNHGRKLLGELPLEKERRDRR